MVRRWVTLGAVAAAGLGIACSSSPTTTNNCGSGTAPSLVGSYSLTSYTYGITVYTPPGAFGKLWYAYSTYADTITVPGSAGDSTTVDSGTYQVVGSECINQQSLAGQRDFAGTFKLTTSNGATTLRVDGNDSLHVIISIWSRSP